MKAAKSLVNYGGDDYEIIEDTTTLLEIIDTNHYSDVIYDELYFNIMVEPHLSKRIHFPKTGSYVSAIQKGSK